MATYKKKFTVCFIDENGNFHAWHTRGKSPQNAVDKCKLEFLIDIGFDITDDKKYDEYSLEVLEVFNGHCKSNWY